jgi:ferredoxin
MAYVITDDCVKDLLCVDECVTGAIHPAKDEPELDAAPQLYINAEECLDCGACVSVCASNAIYAADDLPPEKRHFVEDSAAFYAKASA